FDFNAWRRQLSLIGADGIAFAEDVGGHTLANLALGEAVFEECEIGMRVDVDEAGSDDQASGVADAFRLGVCDGADGDDLAGTDGGIAVEAGRAAAVHDLAAADEKVVGRFVGEAPRDENEYAEDKEKQASHDFSITGGLRVVYWKERRAKAEAA